MTEKKIIKASDLKKTNKKTSTTNESKSKPKLDLGKIKDIIDDNPEAFEKIKEGVTEIITNKVTGKSSTKKTTRSRSKKTTTSSSSDSLSKVIDIAGTLFKK